MYVINGSSEPHQHTDPETMLPKPPTQAMPLEHYPDPTTDDESQPKDSIIILKIKVTSERLGDRFGTKVICTTDTKKEILKDFLNQCFAGVLQEFEKQDTIKYDPKTQTVIVSAEAETFLRTKLTQIDPQSLRGTILKQDCLYALLIRL